jgi:hypothetical protein
MNDEWPEERWYVKLERSVEPPDAYELLRRLAEDEELRERIQSNPRDTLRDEIGLEYGPDLPMQATIILPPPEEIRKVLDRLEDAQPLEFEFDPFGGYYPGQQPFIGILLVALIAGL